MTAAPSKKSLERRVRALEARVEMLESLLRALTAPQYRGPVDYSRPVPDRNAPTHFYEPPCPYTWRPRGVERILGPKIT